MGGTGGFKGRDGFKKKRGSKEWFGYKMFLLELGLDWKNLSKPFRLIFDIYFVT